MAAVAVVAADRLEANQGNAPAGPRRECEQVQNPRPAIGARRYSANKH